MSRFLRFAAFLIVVGLMPGSRELLEQAGHWMVSGHSAHADAHEEGSTAPSEEDECAGSMHFCHCCHLPADAFAKARLTPVDLTERFLAASWRPIAGTRLLLFRPPVS